MYKNNSISSHFNNSEMVRCSRRLNWREFMCLRNLYKGFQVDRLELMGVLYTRHAINSMYEFRGDGYAK